MTQESPLIPAGLDGIVAFVRHGESELVAQGRFQGQADSPLTDLGRRQALLTARRIARRTRRPALPLPAGAPHAIVHSPLLRTTETATLIARAVSGGRGDAALAAPVQLTPEAGLLEIGQGEWEGLPGQEIVERWGDLLAAWRREPLTAWAPGGESLADVDARVRPALRQLLAGLAIAEPATAAPRSQVLGYADVPSDEPWSIVVGHDGVFKVALLALLDLPLARFWMLPFALCGISVIEIRGGRPRLRLLNATDHLADLEVQKAAEPSATEPRVAGAL
ncbi:MAG: phosphoserine phosphatase [Chloroflexota bacterium]|jgi:broad specificity phosphatase PhoE|nr:phosphoserine phosphatase [Chloroflexota bacterium]